MNLRSRSGSSSIYSRFSKAMRVSSVASSSGRTKSARKCSCRTSSIVSACIRRWFDSRKIKKSFCRTPTSLWISCRISKSSKPPSKKLHWISSNYLNQLQSQNLSKLQAQRLLQPPQQLQLQPSQFDYSRTSTRRFSSPKTRSFWMRFSPKKSISSTRRSFK